MIPARLGSQRLKKKNLQLLKGIPLIAHAIQKTHATGLFDEVWVNSEADEIKEVAEEYGCNFHKRPAELANNQATSEDFVYEFLTKHNCDYVVQVHSIAPLLSQADITRFVNYLKKGDQDTVLCTEEIQIECAYKDEPINFDYSQKTNSQDLTPIQRISWSITAWKRSTYLAAYEARNCATYSGKIGYYPIDKLASHVIKSEQDLLIAESLLELIN